MALDALIVRFGLPAIFVGAGVEGEPFAIAGGFLAHRHFVPLSAAIAAATAGSLLIDQMWFFLGRYARSSRWVAKMRRRPAFDRMLGVIERHPVTSVLFFRFAYGLRAVAPVAIGTSRVPVARFVTLNLAAAAVWGPAFTLAGYVFGHAIDRWLPGFGPYGIALGAAVSIGVAIALFARRHR